MYLHIWSQKNQNMFGEFFTNFDWSASWDIHIDNLCCARRLDTKCIGRTEKHLAREKIESILPPPKSTSVPEKGRKISKFVMIYLGNHMMMFHSNYVTMIDFCAVELCVIYDQSNSIHMNNNKLSVIIINDKFQNNCHFLCFTSKYRTLSYM